MQMETNIFAKKITFLSFGKIVFVCTFPFTVAHCSITSLSLQTSKYLWTFVIMPFSHPMPELPKGCTKVEPFLEIASNIRIYTEYY